MSIKVKGNSKIALPGGQARLREAILYVSDAYRDAEIFGQTKLNKTIWRADFRAFAERGVPVTGREYQRLINGPCLVEMVPVQRELALDNLISYRHTKVGKKMETRVVPTVSPSIRYLGREDLPYLDEAIRHYWDQSATEASDESHGPAWRTHRNGQRLNYETALLIDGTPGLLQFARLESLGRAGRWQTA
jgi:hypothetical protein